MLETPKSLKYHRCNNLKDIWAISSQDSNSRVRFNDYLVREYTRSLVEMVGALTKYRRAKI